MSNNKKQTSGNVVKLASETLRNPNTSQTAKSLAGSAMAQFGTSKQTGANMESFASKGYYKAQSIVRKQRLWLGLYYPSLIRKGN